MPYGQPAQPRARRQTTKNPKGRWSSAEKSERNKTTDSGSSQSRTSQNRSTSAGAYGSSRPSGSSRATWTDRRDVSTGEGSGRSYDRSRSTRPRDDRSSDDRTLYERYSDGQTRDRSRDQRSGSDRPRNDRSRNDWPRDGRPSNDRPRNDRPRNDWSRDDRSGNDRPRTEWSRDGRASTDRPRNDRPRNDRPGNDRPGNDRPRNDWSRDDRPSNDRSRSDRPRNDRPRNDRPRNDWSRTDRSSDDRDRREQPSQLTPRVERPVTPRVEIPTVSFAELGLPNALVDGLAASGITTTFPIQAATIPDALNGRDVLGRGQTGSGKTLAFGLPMLARLASVTPAPTYPPSARKPRGVVLLPTRELAMQVHDALAPLAGSLKLSLALVAGGMSYTPQLRAFERGVDVVIATPGRLIDLMERGSADLSSIEITVLDEADHMADLGFLPAVTTVLDTVPANGQRLLFSATLDDATGRLVRTYLDNPVTHEVDNGQASVSTMDHRIVHIQPKEKALVTAEIAGRDGRTVIFVRTQLGAERVAEQLRDSGVLAGALHGGLNQSVRTRILAAFKDGELPVLVATDVAARGIHVDDIGLVLQVDPPAGPKEYLHRAGRTARAGGKGVVVTLALPQQRRDVRRLTSQAGVEIEPMIAGPGDHQLAEVTGAQAPNGMAVTRSEYDKVIAPKRPAARGRGNRPRQDRPGQRRRSEGPGRGGNSRGGSERNGRQASGPRP